MKKSLFAAVCIVLLFPAVEPYFVGDPGVFDQMIGDYGSGMNGLNNSGMQVFMMDGQIVGKASPLADFRVLDLLKLLLPSIAQTLGIDDSTSNNNPFNFPVDNFTLNTGDGSWCLGTRQLDTFVIIEDFMTLSEVTVIVCLSMDMEANSLADRFEIGAFAIAGVWEVGNVGLEFKFSKTGRKLYFQGKPASGEIPVGEFVQYLGSALLPDEFAEPLKNAGLERFSIKEARFIGVHNVDGFAIGLSGNPTIEGLGGFRCHLVIHRYLGRSYQEKGVAVTIALNFPSFSLSNLIRKLTGYDISQVPFLGTLTIPETGVIVSTKTLNPLYVPEVFDGLFAQVRPVYKGVTLAAALPIVPNQSPVVFIINIGSGGLKLTIADPGKALTVGNVLRAIAPDFDFVAELDEVPPGISDMLQTLLNVQIFGFSLSTKPLCIAVELRLNEPFEVIPDIARIINPSIFINVTLSKPRTKVIKAGGFWEFGSAAFPISIEPAPLPPVLPGKNAILRKPKGFLLTGVGDEVSVKGIIEKFDADFLPDELQAVLESASMLDIAIENPMFKIPVGTGAKGFQIQLSGRPRVNGWNGVTLNGVVSKSSGKAALAVGIEFENIGLADLIQKLTGKNVKGLSLLDRSMKVAFIVSSRSMEDVVLAGDALSQIPLRRGLSVVAVFSFPSDCAGDSFCEFAKGAIGASASLQISVTISSLSQFNFMAGVNNINLGGGIVLSQAGLEFAIGKETYVGITGTLQLSDPPLSFTGWVRAGLQGLELAMTMNGIWERAFGLDFLAFGNGIIGITLKPGVPIPGLELGGEIRVGKIGTGKEIIAKCYLGFDPINPRRNYFYGSISAVTVQSLLEAFGLDISLPQCLAESGLPEGLLVSFAFDARELVPSGIVIPQGFVLNGTINILGWRLKAYVNVGLPRGIKIHIRMDPLNLGGGVLKLYQSSIIRSSGPLLVADVSLIPPKINVTAAGYVSLFFGMIEREIFLQITNQYFIFWIRGRFFLFDALLKVYAAYGSLESASFQVYGRLSTEWMDEIREKALAVIDDGAKKATKKISEAQDKVRRAESKWNDAISKLQEKQDKVDRLCSLRRCNDKCVGCSPWKRCCVNWWGKCTGCFSGWDSCCWKAKDVICETANVGCKGLRAVAYGALELAKKIVDSSRWTLDVAVGVLEAAKVTVKIGAEAAKFIVNLGLGGIINIKLIEFDVKIGLVSEGHFKGRIVVSFLRKHDKDFSFDLRLKSVKDMALDLADAIFPGISGRKKRDVVEMLRRSLPDFSHRHYFPEMYLHHPGSEESLQRLKFKLSPIYVSKRKSSLPRKRSVNQDWEDEKLLVEEAVADIRKQVQREEENVPILDEEPDTETKATILSEELDEILDSDETKCKHFYVVEGFIRQVPEALAKSSAQWRDYVKNFTRKVQVASNEFESIKTTEIEMDNAAEEAEKEFKEFEEEEKNMTETIAEWEELSTVQSKPIILTSEEKTMFMKNFTKPKSTHQFVEKLSEEYDRLNSTIRDRLVQQNANAIRHFAKAFNDQIYQDTGRNLPEYLKGVFDSLASPYEDVKLTDSRYDTAQNILESIRTIQANLNTLLGDTLFSAKKISDSMLRELDEIENTDLFCIGTDARKFHLDSGSHD